MPRSGRTRLTDSPEFERVYKQGTALRGRFFSLHAYPNKLGNPRLGLSVSKKVGNAVTRNTVRRRLKEIFHSAMPDMTADLDLVVSARPASADATFEELNVEFVRSLSKLNSKGQKAKRVSGF